MLCCPTCEGKLDLEVLSDVDVVIVEDSESLSERVIRDGILSCAKCRVWYPVIDYVPVMLTFATQVHRKFARKYKAAVAALKGFSMPNGKPNPGERAVQETFSDEWDKLQSNTELSFLFTADDLVELNRQVWLAPLQKTLDEFKTVLNVGVGLGQETVAVQKAIGNAEIVAVDLNFALLQRGTVHLKTPRFHLVIASLFQMPFRRKSFDVVYSQGVLHHTYSTKLAFESISRFVRDGGHLFTWVYALDSHLLPKGLKGLYLRSNLRAEKILRPIISRSPKVVRSLFFTTLSLATHPVAKAIAIHKDKWTLQNTDHGWRDLLSPRYAFRHSYNEVLEWFESQGFEVVGVQSPLSYRRLFGKQLYGVGVLGRRGAAQGVVEEQPLEAVAAGH
jgi:ubiquinone/menaquinone biosynthesis C-methylase UbiE/uncharacterized protein YbaR (Trm112 family)